MLYPLKLTPFCVEYLWGGSRLIDEYGKEFSSRKLAETWELSCHADGMSHIANGRYAGKTLPEYIGAEGRQVLGSRGESFEDFPVLIKLIDACDKLSVQVHPDDAYAKAHSIGYGKTEMWYVVDAEPGATLIYGFKRDVTKEEFAESIKNNTLLELVNLVKVKKGDCFFIPAGMIHAIGAGILIAEIQQSSNTTYRIYDYDRKDKDGNLRELHVSEALEVTSLAATKEPNQMLSSKIAGGALETLLASCDKFTVKKLEVKSKTELTAGAESFQCLLCLSGSASVSKNGKLLTFKKGESVFIPAGFGSYKLNGPCEVILTEV